jgi:hypothetical protein
MMFDPISGVLRTNDGIILKRLDCPVGATRSDIIDHGGAPNCSICGEVMIDLDGLDDEVIERIFRERPDQCVFFSLEGSNVKVTIDGR